MKQVVHLSDEAHAIAKAFCKEHRLRMSEWVGAVVMAAAKGGNMPVLKKPTIVTPPSDNSKDPYAQPPFWANRPKPPPPKVEDEDDEEPQHVGRYLHAEVGCMGEAFPYVSHMPTLGGI